jgi:hypothetical protein
MATQDQEAARWKGTRTESKRRRLASLSLVGVGHLKEYTFAKGAVGYWRSKKVVDFRRIPA